MKVVTVLLRYFNNIIYIKACEAHCWVFIVRSMVCLITLCGALDHLLNLSITRKVFPQFGCLFSFIKFISWFFRIGNAFNFQISASCCVFALCVSASWELGGGIALSADGAVYTFITLCFVLELGLVTTLETKYAQWYNW